MLAVFSLKSGSLIRFYWAMSCSVLARSVSFFVSALATVAMFDHWRRSQFVLWKLMLWFLPSSPSFAINVSSQVLGTPCWRHNPSMPGKQPSNQKEPANHEKIAAGEFFAIVLRKFAVQRSDILVGFPWSRGIKQFNQTRLVRITHRRLSIWLDPIGMLDPQIVVHLSQ
jgi:hypothetical protein